MFKKQSGFTLIELVVVIVILGILAATALPRFISITTDARIAKMNGIAAAMASAGSLAHAAQLVANAASNASISMEGSNVTMSSGYPTDNNTTGIQVAANINTVDFIVTSSAGPYVVTPDTGHSNCKITYTNVGGGATPTVDKTQVQGATGQTNCS